MCLNTPSKSTLFNTLVWKTKYLIRSNTYIAYILLSALYKHVPLLNMSPLVRYIKNNNHSSS